jgi:hypothetical protein
LLSGRTTDDEEESSDCHLILPAGVDWQLSRAITNANNNVIGNFPGFVHGEI